MEPHMVLPGDEVAVAEEFESGEGTYERHGHVFAAVPGVLDLDAQSRVARVRAFNPPAELRVGDIVYAVVDDLRSMMATATVNAIHGRSRQISGEAEGTVHISTVSQDYVEDLRDAFHPGDIVRAKVIQVRPSVQLTTAEPFLGVVKALCSNCRGPLEARGSGLFCPKCERPEHRKLAVDYADLKLEVPARELGGGVVTQRPRDASRGGRDRGGRGREGGGRGGRDRGGRGRDHRRPREGGRGPRDRDSRPQNRSR